MYEELLMRIAVRVLEVWLLSMGFQPTGDFEPDYDVKDFGPHRVYTVQARVPDGIIVDRDMLMCTLQEYLRHQARLPGAIKFQAYNIEQYYSPYCGGYVFASIVHTA